MRLFFFLTISVLTLILASWLSVSWAWCFIIGLTAGYFIMQDEYQMYTKRSNNLRQKCWDEDILFDPVASLGKRGEFLTGILVNGTAIGLFLCFVGRVVQLFFLT